MAVHLNSAVWSEPRLPCLLGNHAAKLQPHPCPLPASRVRSSFVLSSSKASPSSEPVFSLLFKENNSRLLGCSVGLLQTQSQISMGLSPLLLSL